MASFTVIIMKAFSLSNVNYPTMLFPLANYISVSFHTRKYSLHLLTATRIRFKLGSYCPYLVNYGTLASTV